VDQAPRDGGIMKASLELQHDGRVARIWLDAPKANILDIEMMSSLETIVESLEPMRELRAIVFSGRGEHFSFGASVEEHLPGRIEKALHRLGSLLRRVAAAPAPTIAAVRGRCLGGGFELALACDLIVAEESAQLALPEIRLGVFPPAGAALLPLRVGLAGASAMVLTGAAWNGVAAHQRGLVARLAPDGRLEETLESMLLDELLPRSPAALRHAAHAIRTSLRTALQEDLPAIEATYLLDLMKEPDATEGITAFLEKREPQWRQRVTS
jgi:cyclohexa-1,5-dienecarbonyl-CoA hydratase